MTILKTLIQSGVVATIMASAITTAQSQAVPRNYEPKKINNVQKQPTSQLQTTIEREENNRTTYRVCFYPQQNYHGKAFCKSAPSRIGNIGRRIQGQIQSIKITNSYGSMIKSPKIALKVCENKWRRGTCQTFNGSQSSLQDTFPNAIKSYAFKVNP